MMPYTLKVAGTFAFVRVSRPSAFLDYTATCGCGWRGMGWTDREPAERDARGHECAPRRKCCATVTVPVVGTRPASSFRRRCQRWAMVGSSVCHAHRDEHEEPR